MSKQPIAPEVYPATRIITLLEANDTLPFDSDAGIPGQWTNNLAENTVLREGDAISVKQSMIDTTNESENLIDVGIDEQDITIQFGMYLQDSGNGAEDGGSGQSTETDNFLTYSGDVLNTPSGKNYILQNFSDLPFTECWYQQGAQPAASGLTDERSNPIAPPANDFSIQITPDATSTDWWEYTINITGGATYAAPTPPAGGFPFPPTSAAPTPIIAKENLQGLKSIYATFQLDGKLVSEFRIYANGYTPTGAAPDPDTDHIGQLSVIYDEKTGRIPLGYKSSRNLKFVAGAIPEENRWVFRNGFITNPEGDPAATNFQFFLNADPITLKPSKIFRVCTSFRLMVDSFNGEMKDNPTNAPYQQTLSFDGYYGKETLTFNFSDWANASQPVYGNASEKQKGLFQQYELTDDQAKQQFDLIPTNETATQFGPYQNTVFWVQFNALPDSKNPLVKIFEPFVYDEAVGITALPYSNKGSEKENRHEWGGKGFGFGCYGAANPGLSALFLPGQISSEAIPLPIGQGINLIPRIFTKKISITHGKYTYSALAQELTDKLNEIPKQVQPLNNNPFPLPTDIQPANNPTGYSSNRLLTSSLELSYQQSVNATDSFRLPTFPSNQAFDPATDTEKQPLWVSEDGTECCQYDHAIVAAQPRWCGAEALSFLYDESSDTFQIAQSHTNMYSRLDAGVILRQFSVGNNTERITCDKMGGIFFTSLEPTSLFFDKMKFIQSEILVQHLTSGPSLQNFATGTIDRSGDHPQNTNIANCLTHVCRLIPGRNITGNYLGVTSHIDKRVKTQSASPAITGGNYGIVRTEYDLDIAVDTPITIKGNQLTNIEETDPFFSIEISGMNRQDLLGASTKNNLIQTIVGKYFSNGGYTTGSPEDGFRYVHQGNPITLRSMHVRILNSDGEPASGLGSTSAVILQIDTDK